MASLLSELSWSPSSGYPTPTGTHLTSVNPTHLSALSALLSQAIESLATITYKPDLILVSENIRGVEASMTIIKAQEVLATATDLSVMAEATKAIYDAGYNLKELAKEENLYGYDLNVGANVFFFVIFTFLFLFNLLMVVKSRYHWYNVTFTAGYALEFLGFLGRILGLFDNANLNYFLLQYVCLTISPAFIMAGVYFLFAQNVIVHGRQYSVLKPMWYSYFFVFTDVFSLIIQGLGGAMASVAMHNKQRTAPGTWTMFGGVLFQVAAMCVFLIFWFEFISRLNFKDAKVPENFSELQKKTPFNWIKLWANVPSVHTYKETYLEPSYNPRYKDIRARKLVPYYPFAISVAVILIFARCVYRVVELKEGFAGYLLNHEVFIMVLDAMLIALAGLVFVPFHPVFVFGKENVLKLATIKKNADHAEDELTNIETSELGFKEGQ